MSARARLLGALVTTLLTAACASGPPPLAPTPPPVDFDALARTRRAELLRGAVGIDGLARTIEEHPAVAMRLLDDDLVVALFRKGRMELGAYVATRWVDVGPSTVEALASDSERMSQADVLAALGVLMESCGPRCNPKPELRPAVEHDWADVVAYLLRRAPPSRAKLNVVDPESGHALLNDAKSPRVAALLRDAGAIAQTPEQIASTRAEYAATKAREAEARARAREEERREREEARREERERQAAEDEKEIARIDAERDRRQQEADEHSAQRDAAWKAASDSVDAMKRSAQDRQAERLRDLQAAQSRQAEARAEAEKRADAARAARERSAEAARSERERSAAEAQKRAAEDAAGGAAEARSAEQARRAEEQKREAEARSKGPEVFISIYFTTDFPDVYYDKGTAERMAIDRRIVASGRQCNAEKGNFYPQEFHDPGLLNCQEKEDRFAKKTVFRCRHVQVIAKCRRSR